MGRNRKSNRGSAPAAPPTPSPELASILRDVTIHKLLWDRHRTGNPHTEELQALGVRSLDAFDTYLLKRNIEENTAKLSEAEQVQLLQQITSEMEAAGYPNALITQLGHNALLIALVYRGSPQVRWNAMLLARKSPLWWEQIGNGFSNFFEPLLEALVRNSMEYLLLQAAEEAGVSNEELRNLDVMNPSEEFLNKTFNSFMRYFTLVHTEGKTNNVLGAAMQTAMEQVGVNTEATNAKSFYPPGSAIPTVSPIFVEYLKKQYRRTQERLPDMVDLYRGTDDLELGIPMSPWSTRLATAIFNGKVHSARIPKRYIFMTHDDPNFISQFRTEKEHLVLESGLMKNVTRRTPAKLSQYDSEEQTDYETYGEIVEVGA